MHVEAMAKPGETYACVAHPEFCSLGSHCYP